MTLSFQLSGAYASVAIASTILLNHFIDDRFINGKWYSQGQKFMRCAHFHNFRSSSFTLPLQRRSAVFKRVQFSRGFSILLNTNLAKNWRIRLFLIRKMGKRFRCKNMKMNIGRIDFCPDCRLSGPGSLNDLSLITSMLVDSIVSSQPLHPHLGTHTEMFLLYCHY